MPEKWSKPRMPKLPVPELYRVRDDHKGHPHQPDHQVEEKAPPQEVEVDADMRAVPALELLDRIIPERGPLHHVPNLFEPDLD